jgi:hypothetical protein
MQRALISSKPGLDLSFVDVPDEERLLRDGPHSNESCDVTAQP